MVSCRDPCWYQRNHRIQSRETRNIQIRARFERLRDFSLDIIPTPRIVWSSFAARPIQRTRPMHLTTNHSRGMTMIRTSITSAGRQSQTGSLLTRAGLFAGRPAVFDSVAVGRGIGVARWIDGDRSRAADWTRMVDRSRVIDRRVIDRRVIDRPVDQQGVGPVGMMVEHASIEHWMAKKATIEHGKVNQVSMAAIKPNHRPAAGRDPKG